MPAVSPVLRNLLRSNCRLSTTTTPACSFALSEQTRPQLSSTHLFSRCSFDHKTNLPESISISSRPFSSSRSISPALRPIIASPSAPHYPFWRTKTLRDHFPHRLHSSTSATESSPTMTNNGDTRSKRKQPPTPSNDRPMKQIKSDSSEYANGGEPSNGVDMPLDMDDGRTMTRAPTTADTAEWQNTVQKVIKNVVSIHFCQTCSFDTDPAVASEATGFVVDAEKGYILTNRVSWCSAVGVVSLFKKFTRLTLISMWLVLVHFGDTVFSTTMRKSMSTLSTAILSTTLEYYDSTLEKSNTCPSPH